MSTKIQTTVLVPENLWGEIFMDGGEELRDDILAVSAKKECKDIYMASEVTHQGDAPQSLSMSGGDEIFRFEDLRQARLLPH